MTSPPPAIVMVGDPVLGAVAAPVTAFDDALGTLIDQLFASLAVAEGVGLAAPQIGVGLAVFVYDCPDASGARQHGHVVNPEITVGPDRESAEEGCLSVPGPFHELERATSATVRGVDKTGAPVEVSATGYFARCLQHETDHLQGLLYIDHLPRNRRRRVLRDMEPFEWNALPLPPESVRDDRHPLMWDEIFDPLFAGSDSLVSFYGVVHALASRAETVVDVGCGRGAWAADGLYRPFLDLRGPGRTVIGIDPEDAGTGNETLDDFRRIDDSGRWPLEDASVDVAFCDFTMEHVVDPTRFVSELTRTLRPGGAFVGRTVSRSSPLALAARIVPNDKHARMVKKLQPNRKAADVFPTAYQMNSRRDLTRLFDADYDWAVAHRGGFHHYFWPWPRLVKAVAATEPHLPRSLRMTMVVYARKR